MQILIVDENDKAVGEEDIDVSVAKGMIRRVVKILLVNEQNEILLQTRSSTIFNYPNKIDASAGGVCDPGEDDYEHSVIRETREELGVEVKPEQLKFLGKEFTEFVDDRGRNLRMFIGTFMVKGDFKIEDFKIDSNEVAKVEFFSLDKIMRMLEERPNDFTPGTKKLFQMWGSELQNEVQQIH